MKYVVRILTIMVRVVKTQNYCLRKFRRNMFNELIESYICLGKIIWGPDMGSSTMDIGLLYAYGFISLTSKALRPKTLAVLDCSCPALWKLYYVSREHVSADSHLDRSLPFNSEVSFKNHTEYESWQNCRSIAILHVHITFIFL